ncbi:MAG TPA: hypothetical protein VJ981_09145 [Gammaproteobacteria bacterium]|nr:hypothetical protein [Gammaproteobacteria bacterium]
MKIDHIVNVTEIDDSKKSSYLHIAQPVTLRSMITAKKKAVGVVDTGLYAIKHRDEKVEIPAEFKLAPDIEKYAWEYIPALGNILPGKPLPRLADIISGLYAVSDADYLIYTNLDIGLFPDFYTDVKTIIDDGYDAFCINRIDLPKKYNGVLLDINNMELIPQVPGHKHIGIDCFVFKREIVPRLELGNVYIGFPPVGMVLKTQIEKHSRYFKWFKDRVITYHIGNDTPWKNTNSPYFRENFKQAEGLYVHCF